MILKLQKQIKKMQKEMNDLFRNAQKELEEETSTHIHALKENKIRLAGLKNKRDNDLD